MTGKSSKEKETQHPAAPQQWPTNAQQANALLCCSSAAQSPTCRALKGAFYFISPFNFRASNPSPCTPKNIPPTLLRYTVQLAPNDWVKYFCQRRLKRSIDHPLPASQRRLCPSSSLLPSPQKTPHRSSFNLCKLSPHIHLSSSFSSSLLFLFPAVAAPLCCISRQEFASFTKLPFNFLYSFLQRLLLFPRAGCCMLPSLEIGNFVPLFIHSAFYHATLFVIRRLSPSQQPCTIYISASYH